MDFGTVYGEGVTIDHIQKELIKLVYKDVEPFQTLLPITTAAAHTTQTRWGHRVIPSITDCLETYAGTVYGR